MTRIDIDRLMAELRRDMESLAEIETLNAKALARSEAGADDPLDWAALGYTITTAYSCMESYCLRVAKTFENSISTDAWHKDLLNRMTLAIPNIRPALINREAYKLLDELRAFRHVFRTLYSDRLDPERLSLVQRRVNPALAAFREAHETFQVWLQKLSEEMGGHE